MTSLRLAAFARLSRPLLLGHRGCGAGTLENTLAAIERAADQGADGVEIDVRLCATGEIILAHDPDLARVTDGRDRRAVARLPFRELRRVRLSEAQTVPRLEEVLELCRHRGLCLNVELKRDVPDRRALSAAAARLLRQCDVTQVVFVSSFDPFMLAAFRLGARSVPVGALLHRPERASHRYAPPPVWGVHAVHIERSLVTRARVSAWHRRGMRVHAWTINDPAEARGMIAMGVDGVITDVPAQLQHVMVPACPATVHRASP